MKTLLTISISAFFILSNVNCQPTDMRKSMVHFDQAFLPVLMHTYDGNMYQAKRAVFYLEFQWQKMRNQYEFAKAEPDWQDAFQKIDDWLGDAYYAIDNNRADLALAQLEHVKYEFIALREHYRIDYYLDYLYDFQTAADIMTETSKDEMLCLLEWEDLEEMVAEASRTWRDAQHQPIDVELYELDAEKLVLLQQKMQGVTEAIKMLNHAMDSADRAEVEKACLKLEPAFMQVLWVFGNNNASTTYYAERQKTENNSNSIIR